MSLAKRIVVYGFVIAIATGCKYKKQTFVDKNVAAGEIRSPLQSIVAHLSSENYLTINGKTYRHIRGNGPFYIPIPKLNSILFISGQVDQAATFHLINLRSHAEKIICGGPETFGWDIGDAPKPDGRYTDYVESATTNQLVLVETFDKFKQCITINLNSNTITDIKTTP